MLNGKWKFSLLCSPTLYKHLPLPEWWLLTKNTTHQPTSMHWGGKVPYSPRRFFECYPKTKTRTQQTNKKKPSNWSQSMNLHFQTHPPPSHTWLVNTGGLLTEEPSLYHGPVLDEVEPSLLSKQLLLGPWPNVQPCTWSSICFTEQRIDGGLFVDFYAYHFCLFFTNLVLFLFFPYQMSCVL